MDSYASKEAQTLNSMKIFYSDIRNLEKFLDIPFSRRKIEWYIGNYCAKHPVVAEVKISGSRTVQIDLHRSFMKEQADIGKAYFDPFRRGSQKIIFTERFYFETEEDLKNAQSRLQRGSTSGGAEPDQLKYAVYDPTVMGKGRRSPTPPSSPTGRYQKYPGPRAPSPPPNSKWVLYVTVRTTLCQLNCFQFLITSGIRDYIVEHQDEVGAAIKKHHPPSTTTKSTRTKGKRKRGAPPPVAAPSIIPRPPPLSARGPLTRAVSPPLTRRASPSK
jgi:hypothetical protein